MRKTIGVAFLAAAALTFSVGSGPDKEDQSIVLVYSTDERGELHPCG